MDVSKEYIKMDINSWLSGQTATAFVQDEKFVILGNGGFAREVQFLLSQFDADAKLISKEQEKEITFEDCLVIGIGDPKTKEEVAKRFYKHSFPNIIAKDCIFNHFDIGEGNIICNGNILTTGITMGNFNVINLGCTVGHDVVIGDYNQINPNVTISGNVTIGNRCLIGTGAIILEELYIADDTTIGAGAVVTRSTSGGTYKGIPAKK